MNILKNIAVLTGFVIFSLYVNSDVRALEFSNQFNGAMRIDGESNWIYAEGAFEPGDAARFEKYLRDQQLWKNQRVVLNSEGGSLIEGIKIGQIIRKNGFRTAVSKSVKAGEFFQPAPGICASACVLAFAGGVERGASEGSKVGVHQMSRDYDNIANGAPITVDHLKSSMSETQLLVGLTLTHFMEMGVEPMIVPLMVGTSAEDIRWLTADEARATKIAFEPSNFSPWSIEPFGKGLVAFSRSEDGKKQLTLFCGRNGKMRFILKMDGSPYSDSYLSDVKASQFQVAGATVSASESRYEVKGKSLIISGPWEGDETVFEHMNTLSLYGEVIGSISDIYSLYYFNKSNFTKSVKLARKNCT